MPTTLRYHDPHGPELRVHDAGLRSVPINAAALAAADCALLIIDHSTIDRDSVARRATAVVDARNAVPRKPEHAEKVVRLRRRPS